LAAKNAPNDVGVWPKDDAERAAFQARIAVSKVIDSAPVQEAFNQLRAAISIPTKPIKTPKTTCGAVGWGYCGCEGCPDNRIKPVTSWGDYYKTPVYTAENPRRSRRLANKPKVEYFTKEDEQDEIAEAIEAVCVKKGYEFSDELVTEFEAYLPTADKYATEKYDYNTGKYITRTKPEIAKQWAMYYSTSLQEQLLLKKLSKAIVKYCEKNNIAYQEVMAEKFAAWKADPANKKLITYTYSSFSGCACGSCDPTGTKMANTTSYTYERTPTYCVKQWFSTLKKTIVW
jgi:hypothetical protein